MPHYLSVPYQAPRQPSIAPAHNAAAQGAPSIGHNHPPSAPRNLGGDGLVGKPNWTNGRPHP